MSIEVSKNGKLSSPLLSAMTSEHMKELVSKRPGVLVRYGTLIFLSVFTSIGIACWFVQYPDLVYAKAKLTSINAAKEILSRKDGKLVKLYAKEGQIVKAGEILGFVESTADHQAVIDLSKSLDDVVGDLDKNDINALRKDFRMYNQNLGELQGDFQIFKYAWDEFVNYIDNGFYLRKKAMLLTDLEDLSAVRKNLLFKKLLQERDILLAQKTFDMQDTLKSQRVISDFDYRIERSKLLGKELSRPEMIDALISNKMRQSEKHKEIMELENAIVRQKSTFQQVLNTFRSQIEEWKKKCLLIAPIDGKVSFAIFLQENQQLHTSQVICYVNPESSQYYAELLIPQENFGKVAVGQQVLLKLKAYPDAEFGGVTGVIDFISQAPSDSGYMAKVTLPGGLTTIYNKKIQYREGLVAEGEIVTENMRLLQRFYFNIYKQIRR